MKYAKTNSKISVEDIVCVFQIGAKLFQNASVAFALWHLFINNTFVKNKSASHADIFFKIIHL
jgi:hypothetical protein